MSHSVRIDYESISIECRSICEIAAGQLCKIDSLLEKIEAGSSRLLNDDTETMKKQLFARKAALQGKIDNLVAASEKQAWKGTVYVDSDFFSGNPRKIVNAANELQREVNAFSGREIFAYESLLNDLFKAKLTEHSKNMRLRSAGTITFDKDFSENLQHVDDEVLKGYIYLELLDSANTGKGFSELKESAERRMRASIESHIITEKKNILGSIEAEMRGAKLDEETIQNTLHCATAADETLKIAQIREKATVEIVGESIRKKTLKAVLDCIEKKGFVVDRKNIKHQKDSGEVVMVAQKAGGETAEFRVMLNGKFIYKFHNYEGQACQEDIQPFMHDLEEIYDIKPKKIEEIWRNPDKIGKMRYQTQNHRENKG
jgi:hypothetical protein